MLHTIQQHNSSTSTPVTHLTLGRYRIAALSRELPCRRFAAQVAIASGHGSASTARLMRFEDDFATGADAIRYAEAQGLSWAAERQGAHAFVAPAALHTQTSLI